MMKLLAIFFAVNCIPKLIFVSHVLIGKLFRLTCLIRSIRVLD